MLKILKTRHKNKRVIVLCQKNSTDTEIIALG